MKTQKLIGPSVLLVSEMIFGCGSNQRLDPELTNPATLRDTTGAVFTWNCELPLATPDGSTKTCDVALRAGTPAVPDCGPGSYYIFLQDVTLARVCVAAPRQPQTVFIANMCRAVACSNSRECPQFTEAPFECRNGLCRRTGTVDGALGVVDALSLCLANLPRLASCAAADSDPATQSAENLVETGCGWVPDSNPTPNDFLLSENACPVPASCRQP